MSVTITARSLTDLLDAHMLVKNEGAPILARRFARLCAVELANRTQPWSVSSGKVAEGELSPSAKGHMEGIGAVDGNIRKVIKDPQGLRDIFDKTKKEKLGRNMIQLLNAGRYDILAKVMASCGLIANPGQLVMTTPEEMKRHHSSRRSRSTGKTFILKGQIIFSPSGYGYYIKRVQDRVGYCKSGWADCARKIGGTKGNNARGIPPWASQKRFSNGSIQDNSGDKNNPHFVMTNNVPYVSKLLPENQRQAAVSVARNKLIKALEISFFAAKRGVRAAQESIQKDQQAA